LERSEYDGSEWWTHHLTPTRKPDAEPFTTVHNGDTYASVWEMNRPGGKYAEDEA